MTVSEIHIFTGNHGKYLLAADCIRVVENFFKSQGCVVSLGSRLSPSRPNIIIDEFTNAYVLKYIEDFKGANPSAIFFVVLTEFFTDRLLVQTLNSRRDLCGVAVSSWGRLLLKFFRKDLARFRCGEVLTALLLLPFFPLGVFKNILEICVSRSIRSLRAQAYFLLRRMGIERVSRHINGWFLLHPEISRNCPNAIREKSIGTIYPTISKSSMEELTKKGDFHLGISFSGELTPYRSRVFSKFSKYARFYGVHHMLGVVRIKENLYKDQATEDFFSFQPQKYRRQPFVSPIRVFRSLEIDRSVPVINCEYVDLHPISRLCLNYKGAQSIIDLIDFYVHKDVHLKEYGKIIEQYNSEVGSLNNETWSKFIASLDGYSAIRARDLVGRIE